MRGTPRLIVAPDGLWREVEADTAGIDHFGLGVKVSW